MRRKSQVQIGESIAVIIFFMILVVIGLIFWVKQSGQNQIKEVGKNARDKTVQITRRILNLNELSCTNDADPTKGFDCIDIIKYLVVAHEIKTNQIANNYYMSMFGPAVISIHIIYSYDPKYFNKTFTLYNTTAGKISHIDLDTPVVVYDPLKQDRMLGLLDVAYYGLLD